MVSSYPFLALSRRLGMSYGDVLTCADAVTVPYSMWTAHQRRVMREISTAEKEAIISVQSSELERRQAIIAGRK